MAAAAQALLLGDSQSESTASNLIFDVDEMRVQHDSLPKKTIINLSRNQQRLVVHVSIFPSGESKGFSRQQFLTVKIESFPWGKVPPLKLILKQILKQLILL